MRFLHKVVTTIVLFGFPLAAVTGCSPGSNGTPVPPIAPMQPSLQANAAAAEWSQFGYDAGHSGYNSFEQKISAKNVSKLQIAWNDKKIIQPGGIVVDRNVAYVDDMGQTGQGLYAINVTTGKEKWRANMHLNGNWGSFYHAVAAVAGNVVVSPCSNGSTTMFLTGLCGVDANSGKILWKTFCTQYQGNPCSGLVNNGTSPAYYGSLIYVESVQGVNEQPDVQAINPQTGKVAWAVPGVYHCPDAGLASDNPLPAVNGEVLAVLGCQGTAGGTEICALSASSGAETWCYQSPNVYVEETIAANGLFYVTLQGSDNDLLVLAFNPASGAQVWQAKLPSGYFSTMAADSTRLIVLDGNIGVYALSPTNGKLRWNYTANANLFLGGTLSIANGLVYSDGGGGNNGNVAITAFNENNGKVVWTSGSIGNGGAPAAPVILDGTIYAGCYTLCAFRPKNS